MRAVACAMPARTAAHLQGQGTHMEELTVTQAAARLGVSRDTVLRRIKRGQLQFRQDVNGRYLVEIPGNAPAGASDATGAISGDALRRELDWFRAQLEEAATERAELRRLLAQAHENLQRALPAPGDLQQNAPPSEPAPSGKRARIENLAWWVLLAALVCVCGALWYTVVHPGIVRIGFPL